MADEKEFTTIDLDATLDDIDDLPQFAVFPTGAYVCALHSGIEDKKINEHPALTTELLLKEIVELSPSSLDEEENPPKPGDIATLAFMRDNKFGMGKFKEFAAPLKVATGTDKIRDLMAASKGMEIMIVVKRTWNKEKQQHYMQSTKVVVI